MMMNAMMINDKAYAGSGMSMQDKAETLGLLPMWVAEYNMLGEKETLIEHMETAYGFGSLYKFEGQVLEDGTYRSNYEEDEDMEFVGRMNTRDGYVYFYPYGMIALPTKDGYFVTRMD